VKRPVERIVPIQLNGTVDGRGRSRDKASNPFLDGNGVSRPDKNKPNGDSQKLSNAKLAPTKTAPLATAEVTAFITQIFGPISASSPERVSVNLSLLHCVSASFGD
jgi:hypothetical protein